MTVRAPAAPHFYAGDCTRMAAEFLRGFSAPPAPKQVVAAVVPHAGWQYSGAIAAKVFESIRQKQQPQTLIFFGAAHFWAGGTAVYAGGAWSTPLGEVAVDEPLARHILEGTGGLATDNPSAHEREHAIEVQLPFVKLLFPQAKIVPISVRPDDVAAEFGRRVGEILKAAREPAVIMGSTDLTHYGDAYHFSPWGYGQAAHRAMRENDAALLRLAEDMAADAVVPEARRSHSACGPGALAATVAAATILGAERGHLVEYTTSFDVVPDSEFRMAVGYAGILY